MTQLAPDYWQLTTSAATAAYKQVLTGQYLGRNRATGRRKLNAMESIL